MEDLLGTESNWVHVNIDPEISVLHSELKWRCLLAVNFALYISTSHIQWTFSAKILSRMNLAEHTKWQNIFSSFVNIFFYINISTHDHYIIIDLLTNPSSCLDGEKNENWGSSWTWLKLFHPHLTFILLWMQFGLSHIGIKMFRLLVMMIISKLSNVVKKVSSFIRYT